MNTPKTLFTIIAALGFAVAARAETPLDHYSPAIKNVEASSVLDPSFKGPFNVTDWNWISRWEPKAEGTGAWVRLDFLGEVPIGGVYLVDDANARGTVEAVRFEFPDGETVDYVFPVGHDPNMPQAGLMQWGSLVADTVARPDKGSHFVRFDRSYLASSIKVVITKTRDDGLTRGLAEVRPVIIGEEDTQPLASEDEMGIIEKSGYALKTDLPETAWTYENDEFSITISAETGLITDFISKVPTPVSLIATNPRNHDYLTGWQVAGPYEVEGMDSLELLDHLLPPEMPEAEVTWEVYESSKDGLLRFDEHYLWPTRKVLYLRTRVYSPEQQNLELMLRGDDGIKAWVNGEEVYRNNFQRFVFPYAMKGESQVNGGAVSVVLKQGWNDLQIKLSQEVYEWRLTARFQHLDGRPVEGLQVEGQKINPNAPLNLEANSGGTIFIRNLDRNWEDRFTVLRAYSEKSGVEEGEAYRELTCLIAPAEKLVAFARVKYRIFSDRIDQHIDFQYLVNDWARYQIGFHMPLDYAQWPVHRDSGWGLDELGFETSSERYIRLHGHAYDICWEQGDWNLNALPMGMYRGSDRYLAYGSFELYHHLVFGPNVIAPAASPAVFVHPLGMLKGQNYEINLFFKTFPRETSGYIEGLQWYLSRTTMDDPDMEGIPVRLTSSKPRVIPEGRAGVSPMPMFKGDSTEKMETVLKRMHEAHIRHVLYGGWDAWVHPPEEFEGAEWEGYRNYEPMTTDLFREQIAQMKDAGLYPYAYLNGFVSAPWTGGKAFDPDDDREREWFMARLKEFISLTETSGMFWDAGAPPLHWKWPNISISSDPRGDQGRGWMKLQALMLRWMQENHPEMRQIVNTMAGGSLSDLFAHGVLMEDFMDPTIAAQSKAYGAVQLNHHFPTSYTKDAWEKRGLTFNDLRTTGMDEELTAEIWETYMHAAMKGLSAGFGMSGHHTDLMEHSVERRQAFPDYNAYAFPFPQHLRAKELNEFNALINATGNLPETHVFKNGDSLVAGNVWANEERVLALVYNIGSTRTIDVKIDRTLLKKYDYTSEVVPGIVVLDPMGMATEYDRLKVRMEDDAIRITGELDEHYAVLVKGEK